LKKLVLYIFILISIGFSLGAQDIHFSQFNENLSIVNPALTGASGRIRASVTNRDQWRSVTSPYKTLGASFEMRFKSAGAQKLEDESSASKEKNSGKLAAGLSVYKDKVGDGNLGQTHANLSLATFLPLNKKNIISVGLQASLVQRMLDHGPLIFPDQYNGSVYDPAQSSKDNFTNIKFNYFDLAAGTQWTFSKETTNLNAYKQFTSHFGFAIYHLSQPKQEYLETLSSLSMRYVSHGDLIASIGNSNMAISPSYLLQFQGPSKEIIVGTMLRHYFKTDSKFTGFIKRDCFGYGLYYRSNDAVMLSVLLERQEKFALIMSYDVNISSLVPASSFRGGFEFTLRYTAPRSFHYQKKQT